MQVGGGGSTTPAAGAFEYGPASDLPFGIIALGVAGGVGLVGLCGLYLHTRGQVQAERDKLDDWGL